MKTILSVILIPTLFLLGVSFVSVQAATNQEWTQDAHDAQRTGYTLEEPEEPWTLAWTWNGPDASGGTTKHLYDAPSEARTITGGNFVYAPAGNKGLYALSKQNGTPAWNVINTSFNATPAYDTTNNWVFAGGLDGRLYKIDAQTGAVLQTYSAGSPLNKSVLLVGQFAYVVTDSGQLHKVNTANMTGAWVYSSNAPIATPPSYSPSRDAIIYATNDLYVHAVNNADGKQKWRVKPTPNTAGFPNEMDGAWPVIAEQHGIVFVRMRLLHDALWSGPGAGNMYPNTNAEIRTFLQSKPQLKNLFALSVDTGAEAFVPAVGYGGVEALVNGQAYLDVGPVPVVRLLPDGKEVVYQVFRSGQGNPPDGRWDSHLGEMVLDNQTIPGMVAGDLRFIQFDKSPVRITDEQTPLTLAGNTFFNAHWGASESGRIVDRSNAKGITTDAPITTQRHPTIIRRMQTCSNFNAVTHWTTCGLTLFDDGRYWDGPGWWVYWNVLDPPTPHRSAYSEGILPRYTYVSGGLIVVEGNGGELFVLKHSGSTVVAQGPTPTPIPATATKTMTPTLLPPTTVPPTSTSIPISSTTPQVTTLSANATQVGRYQKFEVTFQISKTYPVDSFLPYYFYDPSDPRGVDGISIDAHFRGSSGREMIVPAFYYQDYVRTVTTQTTMTPTNNFAWKIRFAPDEVGNYAYYITIRDKAGTTRYPASGDIQFQSITSTSKGFVRVSSRDSRFLEFSNGESFVPISSGHQWWVGALRSADYDNTFAEFGKNGVNLTRIWDQNDGYGLTVEGHFDQYKYPDDFNPQDRGTDIAALPKGTQMNQRGNYEEDKIIEAAERNGVYIQLCSHGDAYWIWDASLWNNPPAAQDDPARIRYWERNFRYRVARWGYSTSILAWEHWNELGHVSTTSDIFRFYQAYSQYQQQVDPYKHLRTTSQGSQNWSPAFWSSSLFDLANYHDYMMISRYSADLTYDAANFTYRFAQCLRTVDGKQCGLGLGDGSSWQGPQKPYIWGELDTGTTNWNEANPQPKAIHDVRWAGLFSPIGMAPIDWYYQQQSDAIKTQKHKEAKIAADFFKDIDYAGKGFAYLSTSDVRLTSEVITANQTNLRVLAMRSSNGAEVYAWVQNKGNSQWNSAAVPTALSGTFTIPKMAAGNYKVQYWDTYSGQITDGAVVATTNGNVVIPVNNLTRDIAIKVRSTTQVAPTPTSTLSPTPQITISPATATLTATPTFVPTNTPVPATKTSIPPTLTSTFTPVPPSPTKTLVPPTATSSAVPPTTTLAVPTATNAPISPTPTNTPLPSPTVPPNTAAIQIQVNPASANVGEPVMVTLKLSAVADLYGLQVQCRVDPQVLKGINHAGGDGFNDSNSFFIDQGYQATGSWQIATSRLKPAPAISGDIVAFTLGYIVQNTGSTAINCSALGVNRDGRDLPLVVINGSYNGAGVIVQPTPVPVTSTATVTVPPATPTVQPGQKSTIAGVASYQNGPDNAGITVELLDANNKPLVQVVTNATGAYRFTDVPVGAYSVQLSAPLSLPVIHAAPVPADGQVIDLGKDTLLLGDTDNNKKIDVGDAGLVGANFGALGSVVPSADLNRDGIIDIRDLVLIGANFSLVGPVKTP
jgi:hypothetical protein